MICPNCGASIKNDIVQCPYCKNSIHSSLIERKKQDILLHNRLSEIDAFFGLEINHEYEKLSLKEIERYYDALIQEYDHHGAQLAREKKDKIEEHIERVQEEKQRRYPIRQSTHINSDIKVFNNEYSLVEFLLEKSFPPQLNAAAFKLRSVCERNLRDNFKFNYISVGKVHKFEKTYLEMFRIITKNNAHAKKLVEYHLTLNLFVHESKKNDLELRKKFRSEKDSLIYLKEVLALHKRYKLI